MFFIRWRVAYSTLDQVTRDAFSGKNPLVCIAEPAWFEHHRYVTSLVHNEEHFLYLISERKTRVFQQRVYKGIYLMTFTSLGIIPELEQALAHENITEPTPIQEKAIPVFLEGKDMYISSETGTGKTLAYLLPLFQMIDSSQKTVQAMIIAPTHELAMQILRQAEDLAKHSGSKVRIQALIGNVAVKRQLEGLKKKPHIVVGSVGRMLHLISLKKLKPLTVSKVIVDEVDRLLYGDSVADVRKLIGATSREHQLVFASATAQNESSREAEDLAPEMVNVHVGSNRVNPNIEHLYLVCEERDKPDVLRKLIHALNPTRAIAFVHRNMTAEAIAEKLVFHKLAVGDIHGAHDKLSRKKAMDDLRDGKVQVLIASDVAARGLDFKEVTHIFNVDIPSNSKDYLHRVGRTGRAGASGMAVSLVTPQETRLMKRFQHDLDIVIRPVRLSKGAVIEEEDR